MRDLLALELETLHESWLAVLKEEVVSKEFLALKRFLKGEKESGKVIYPREGEIYSWFVFRVFIRIRERGGGQGNI